MDKLKKAPEKWLLLEEDPMLGPYRDKIISRSRRFSQALDRLGSLRDFATGHLYYGLHKREGEAWVFREWLPHAREVFLFGDFSGWRLTGEGRLSRINAYGDWELTLPLSRLEHGQHYRLLVRWDSGEGERIPAFARRVVQDSGTKIFSAQVWDPPPYPWQSGFLGARNLPPLVYEAHVGMAQERPGVGTFEEFRLNILPRIAAQGYNTLQFMALMEHPYYGSFGYQVSSFFALSSRFGTPEEFKALVEECHRLGLAVVMDLVHSHGVKNEVEGLSRQDGSPYQYFHDGPRGTHAAWDSRCFDYSKDGVLNFLLSNCAFWLDEYHLDGFRFDGVTSMFYRDHGLGVNFDHYDKYFSGNTDEDAFLYLSLANRLVHLINPQGVCIAEDMSGMPGLAKPQEEGGCGFDYRLAMGIPDFWIKLTKEKRDEDWSPEEIWGALNNRRFAEGHIGYAESHDQALVGDKTLIFRMIDAEMYTHMSLDTPSLRVDRGMALYKIIYLLTFSLGGDGFLCFMGNEFGHPEWIDFPREGNGWSYYYARRQWSLADNPRLRYRALNDFNRALLSACRSSLTERFAGLILAHREDQVLAYRRGELVYVINLNPHVSFTHYGIKTGPGNFELVLCTDWGEFNGFGRIPGELTLKAAPDGDGQYWLNLYLPTRSGLVLRRQEDDLGPKDKG
ncbi:MAG: alpha amylase C-terminal domain-containing protein [Spirochaetales bacterium]|nr:alpha amylase C-terminal domain-containing protein [Spirochaetales bacterium]